MRRVEPNPSIEAAGADKVRLERKLGAASLVSLFQSDARSIDQTPPEREALHRRPHHLMLSPNGQWSCRPRSLGGSEVAY